MPLGIIPFPFGKCRICQDKATGLHYGVATCEGCKGFFKRSTLRGNKYKCYFGEECEITPKNRNRCKSCRYKRCLDVGMALDAVRMGRIPKVEKEKVLEVFQQCGSDYNKLELNVQQTDNGSYDFQINPTVEHSMDCDEPDQGPGTSRQGQSMSPQVVSVLDESVSDEKKVEIKVESQFYTEKESRSSSKGYEIPQDDSRYDSNILASASSQENNTKLKEEFWYPDKQSFNQGLNSCEFDGFLNNPAITDIFSSSNTRPSMMDMTDSTCNDLQLSKDYKQDVSKCHMYEQRPCGQSSVNSSNTSRPQDNKRNHQSFINRNRGLHLQMNEMLNQVNSFEDFLLKDISRQPLQDTPWQDDVSWVQKQDDPVLKENNGILTDSKSFSSGSLSFSNLNIAMPRTQSMTTVQTISPWPTSCSVISDSKSTATSQEVSRQRESTSEPFLQPKNSNNDWSTSSAFLDSFNSDTSGNQVSGCTQRNKMPLGMVNGEGNSSTVSDFPNPQTHYLGSLSEKSPLSLQVTKEWTQAVNDDKIEYLLNELAYSSDLHRSPVKQLEREDTSSPNTEGNSDFSFRETNSISSGSSSSSKFNSSLIKIMSDIITETSARQRLTDRLKQILSSKDKVYVESVINLVQNELQNILSQIGSTNSREDKERNSLLIGSKMDDNIDLIESKKRTLRRFLDDIKEFSDETRPVFSETGSVKKVSSAERETLRFGSSSDLKSETDSQGVAVVSSSNAHKSERQEEIEMSLSSLNLAMTILYRLKPEHREKIKLLRLGKINIRIMTDSDEDVAFVYDRIITSIPMLNERIFGFCEHVPRFSGLCKDDKAKLMKRAYYDIWMLTFAEYFRDGKSEMILSTGELYSIEAMRKILNDNMVDTMLRFAEQFNGLELTDLEVSILCAIQLTKAEGLDIEDRQNVLQIHSHLQSVFVYELERNHPLDHSQIITEIFQLLPLLAEINRLQKTIIAPFPTKYKKS